MTDHDEPCLIERIRSEREALQADMARRREQIEREETLAEARQAITPSTECAPPPRDYGRQRRAAAPAPADMTAGWQRYIGGQVKQSEARAIGACMKAVGEVIGKDIIALERRCERLETEIAELRERLDQQRGLRAVPSIDQMIAC